MMLLTPLWLMALLAVPLYGVVARRNGWGVDASQKWLLLSIVLVIFSLARPVIPQKPLEIEQAGKDVILAIDLSYSMRGTDLAPSRLSEAKKILIETVRTHPKDRFGVIGFTTQAIVLSPLTRDTQLLEHLFGALDETQIITKGTDVMSALELSRKMSHAKTPLVILLTDGGDEANYDKEAQFSQDTKLQVNVVMLASQNGSTLPTQDGSALRDEKGHIVVSARNDAINEIASMSDGKVVSSADELHSLIDDAGVEDFTGSSSVSDNQELFTFPLGLALAAFVLAMTSLGDKISKMFIIALVFIGISTNAGVLDFAYLHTASKEYSCKNYERSAQLFEKIDSVQAGYNRANALYNAGKYQEALIQYRQLRSNEPLFKSKLYYNMGNCHIRLGEFENGRNSFLKSLTLHYTKEADENLRFIAQAQEKKTLNARKEKKDQFSQEENAPTGEKKESKSGGGSNMQSDMKSGGGGDEGKKAQGDPRFSASQGKAKLSSRQYELINARSVHETKPW